MRKISIVVGALLLFSALGVAMAAAAGVPEIDRANAVFDLRPTGQFASTPCPGEDGLPYITYRGTWKGVETETTPGFTDYSLSGSLTVKRVVWTINLETKRGVLTGTATLTDASGRPTYSGKLTLITQGVPGPGAKVPGRGWIVASTFTGGAVDGGSLLANVEMSIDGGFSASDVFGDSAPNMGLPDFSVTTVNQDC
ncbi:MAG: hypothetical protein M3P23_09210 [Actinomycetota bacterium]|nr:hypothetical protein [Actinomycetota bacterium]